MKKQALKRKREYQSEVAIAAELAKFWIPTGQQKPIPGIEALVYDAGFVFLATLSDEGFLWEMSEDESEYPYAKFSHWMSLPSDPADQK